MSRRVVAFIACCLLLSGAAPAAAAASDASCRVEMTAVHQRLRSFGIARAGGSVDVVAAATCLDVQPGTYAAIGTVWVEVHDPNTGVWQGWPDSSATCSAPSVFGVTVLRCYTRVGYSDPGLTNANFRGCFDLYAPVDLPVKCQPAVTSP